MNCSEFKNRLDDYLDSSLSADERMDVQVHINACAHCRGRLGRAQAIQDALRQMSAPSSIPADLAERALLRARAAQDRRRALRRGFIGGALAASLVIAVATTVFWPQAQPLEPNTQVLALNEVRPVKLALNSDRALQGVTLTIELPAMAELKGFRGRTVVSWKTNLEMGTNLLALPIIATGSGNGYLVARIEHNNKVKELSIPLTAKPAHTGLLDWRKALS